MTPFLDLLVYGILDDGEMIADSLEIESNAVFENEVTTNTSLTFHLLKLPSAIVVHLPHVPIDTKQWEQIGYEELFVQHKIVANNRSRSWLGTWQFL